MRSAMQNASAVPAGKDRDHEAAYRDFIVDWLVLLISHALDIGEVATHVLNFFLSAYFNRANIDYSNRTLSPAALQIN